MEKGIAFSSIALVSIIVVAAVIGYITYAAYTGTGPLTTILKGESAGVSRSTLETSKRYLALSLGYAGQESSLEVASAGGCAGGACYWISGNPPRPTPPSVEEVEYSVSFHSNESYNAYVKGAEADLEEYGVSFKECDCIGVDAPPKSVCVPKNSEGCESFGVKAEDQYIRVEGTGGSTDTYREDLSGDVANNRFWWIYWNLRRAIEEGDFQAWIDQTVRAECPGPEPDEEKFGDGIKFACDQLGKEYFDKYVNVTCEILCLQTTSACLNEEPKRDFNEPLCWQAQGTTSGSYRIKINATDYKYYINQHDYVSWIIWTAMETGVNCRVVD